MASIKVTGVREFVRAARTLGVEIEDLKDAMGAVARLGAASAASFAPKRTGALAADVRGNRAQMKATVAAGRASLRYAGPINYGWTRRHIRGAFFMQKADAVWKPYAMQRLKQEIDQKIRQTGLQ